MPKLGILEDRRDQRETLLTLATINLPEGWVAVEIPLLQDPSRYPDWLLENDVPVMIADYRLNEQSDEHDQQPVEYMANRVIEEIHSRLPEYPIFILTAATEADELDATSGGAETIMRRQDFGRNTATVIQRMIRAGTRFSKRFTDNLSELGSLAALEASGTASAEDRERIRALQTFLGFEAISEASLYRDDLLSKLEAEIRELRELQQSLRSRVESAE